VCANFASLLATVSHDAFRVRGKGLSLSAAFVLHELPCRTADEISERTGLSVRTVRSALAALQDEGLVVKDGV
jgi:DNA-binding IclR family transcriptional regulator